MQNLDPKMVVLAQEKFSTESVWGKIFVPFEECIPPVKTFELVRNFNLVENFQFCEVSLYHLFTLYLQGVGVDFVLFSSN